MNEWMNYKPVYTQCHRPFKAILNLQLKVLQHKIFVVSSGPKGSD